MSDSLWLHGLQHARLPCPSPTTGACPDSCLLSQWCHPTISSSAVPFSHLQSFQASRSFPMSQLLPSSGQSIGASASVLPMNIQSWFFFRIDLFNLVVQGTLNSLLQHHSSRILVLWRSAFFMVQISYPYMTTGKTIALIIMDLSWQNDVSAFQYAI